MSSELSNVIIRSYETPEELIQQSRPRGTFEAMFNPGRFAVSNIFNFDDRQSDAEIGSEQKFRSIRPKEFNFDFLIDGTGATGETIEVEDRIEEFKDVTGFTRNERRPFYLTLSWGFFTIRCVLKGMNVNYTLFKPNGTPVRAIIKASFAEYKTPAQQERENPLAISTALTQIRDVFDGDNLSNLAQKIYGDATRYLDIASENGLNNVRELLSGDRLEFPPIDQLIPDSLLQAGQDAFQQLASGVLDQGTSLLGRALSQAADLLGGVVPQGEAILQQAVNQGTAFLSGTAGQGINQLSGALGQLSNQAGAIVGQGGVLLDNLTGQVGGLLGGLNEQTGCLLSGLNEQISGLSSGLEGQAAGLLGGATDQLSGLVGGISGSAAGGIDQLNSLTSGLSSQLTNVTGGLVDQASSQLGQLPALVQGISNQGGDLLDGLTSQGSSLLGGAADQATGFAEGAIDRLTDQLFDLF